MVFHLNMFTMTILNKEVERAAKLLRDIAQHNEIIDVETTEDTLVYSGTTHTEFVSTESTENSS